MKRTKWKLLTALLLVAALAFAAGCTQEPASTEPTEAPAGDGWTVTFFDSDGVSVLQEVSVADGATVERPELTREGYVVKDFYATPALLIPFDFSAAITADTSVFVAWQSSVADERAWMLAGSLAGYPANNWGHAWPQDDFLLQPVEGAFNTFSIEVNLYEGDEFKIAVIDQDYNWGDAIDSSALTDRTAMAGGEDAFATGANILVLETAKYRLTLETDAETLALCKLSYEKIGEADELSVPEFDFQVQGNFNGWGANDPEGDKMTKNGEEFKWFYFLTVTEEMYDTENGNEFASFGIKNLVSGDWYDGRNVDPEAAPNFSLTAGEYMVYLEIELVNNLPTVKNLFVAEPAYYVVGTCGNKGWAADVAEENTAFRMEAQEDGTYSLTVTFTDADTDSWTEGKVAFKVAYGANGAVANEKWYGDGADNILVDPGEYTIVLDPATGTVTY